MCDYGRLTFPLKNNSDYMHSMATPGEQRERKSSLPAAIALH